MRLQNMLRGQRLPPIPHLLSIMVQPKQVSPTSSAPCPALSPGVP